MNTAEQLRKEMEASAPFTKDEFIEAVKNGIRNNGRFSFCVNARTERGYSLSGGASIPLKYLELVKRWASEEGFAVTRFSNYYGVPEYDVTL